MNLDVDDTPENPDSLGLPRFLGDLFKVENGHVRTYIPYDIALEGQQMTWGEYKELFKKPNFPRVFWLGNEKRRLFARVFIHNKDVVGETGKIELKDDDKGYFATCLLATGCPMCMIQQYFWDELGITKSDNATFGCNEYVMDAKMICLYKKQDQKVGEISCVHPSYKWAFINVLSPQITVYFVFFLLEKKQFFSQ